MAAECSNHGDDIGIQMEPILNSNHDTPSSKHHLTPENVTKILRGPLAPLNNFLDATERAVVSFCRAHQRVVKIITYTVLLIGYLAYFVSACVMDFSRARDLLYLTVVAVLCVLYWLVKKYFGAFIWTKVLQPIHVGFVRRYARVIKWLCITAFAGFVLFWIIYDTVRDPPRLISLAGLLIYVLIGYFFSNNRSRIKWRPVLWGFALQFVFGVLILRTNVGYSVLKWIGDRVTIFLGFSSEGSTFLFRGLSQFAFTVLPIIVYFAAATYVLWYLGVIHVVIRKIAWLLQVTMGTSPAESFNAAGNIFIGQTEAPLLIRPFLAAMTESELHAVMTGGFATVAGAVLASFIMFGVSAQHLLAASVMSAPAALAMSKLMCPEVEEPAVKTVDDIVEEKMEEKNVFEAIAVGAAMSISLVANIAVMLIAFVALLKCANSILSWLGSMVGVPGFSFEFICSYLLMPFAFIMGVPWEDSFKVAELLGVKIFLNEFIAYQRFSVFIRNKAQGHGDVLSLRTEVITTYALCGFANFTSLGVQLGGIGALVPSKRSVLAKHVLRAMIAGTLACFMTACIAGVLYEENDHDSAASHNATTLLNATLATTLNAIANTTL